MGHVVSEARREAMAALRRRGETYAAIGGVFGVGAARAAEVVARHEAEERVERRYALTRAPVPVRLLAEDDLRRLAARPHLLDWTWR
jgi:hypothetical protein